MKSLKLISYLLLNLLPLLSFAPIEENSPKIQSGDRPSGAEYIKNLMESYISCQYLHFLTDMEAKYQRHPNQYEYIPKEEEKFFWKSIEEENYKNKQSFLDKLELFAKNSPESSLGKAIAEFLSFSLTDEGRIDIYFFSESINEISSSLIKNSKTYQDLWNNLKKISHSYKVKHAILNEEFLTSETGNTELKAQHIILDIAMKEEIVSLFEENPSILLRIENSFCSYLKYLAFEYNSHYLTLLLERQIDAKSEQEIYIQNLMDDFKQAQQKIKQAELDWIEAACDGGYTEI